jgi:hypothetical protein
MPSSGKALIAALAVVVSIGAAGAIGLPFYYKSQGFDAGERMVSMSEGKTILPPKRD